MENKISVVDLKKNDNFSTLKKEDLRELILEISNYYLKLRDTIGINHDITFGLEIEIENIIDTINFIDSFEKINPKKEKDSWECGRDTSLRFGSEIRSEILRDEIKNWKKLKEVCDCAATFGNIGEHCAGHIHLGAHTLTTDINNWLNFLKFWATYEHIIYRFVFNEYYTKLPGIKFCNPKSIFFENIYEKYKRKRSDSLNNMIKELSFMRTQSVNFQNINVSDLKFKNNNTVEFRCPNGTLNPVIWQNNVNLFTKIFEYVISDRFDIKLIERKYNENQKYLFYNFYGEIFLKEAIEFVDILFQNNEDKIYFLRQYFKDFNILSQGMKLSKKFTFDKELEN